MFNSFDLKKFGEYIRQCRKSLGYTQKKVAILSTLSTDTLRRIENGEVVPRYDTLVYLSLTYKEDLLTTFASYSNANNLFDFYQQLEDIILRNDLSNLEKLKKDFTEYKHQMKDGCDLINISELKQFELILSSTKKHYTSAWGDLDDCVAAMKISHPKFQPELFNQFKYTKFELRILFMIATSLSCAKTRLSNDILLFCLSRLDESIHSSLNEKLLRSKIFVNLSYNYHRMDDHRSALDVANDGIIFCNKHYLLYGLAALFYRKGIAQFHLKHPNYLEGLQLSIQILHMQGATELLELYKKATKDIYGITLSC